MRNILKKIINFIKKAILVIISLFANLFLPTKREEKKKESVSNSQKETAKKELSEKTSNLPTTPETKVLENQTLKFAMTKEELEKELENILKGNAPSLLKKVKAKDKETTKWQTETIKKIGKLIEQEEVNNIESVQKQFEKEIKQYQEKDKIPKQESVLNQSSAIPLQANMSQKSEKLTSYAINGIEKQDKMLQNIPVPEQQIKVEEKFTTKKTLITEPPKVVMETTEEETKILTVGETLPLATEMKIPDLPVLEPEKKERKEISAVPITKEQKDSRKIKEPQKEEITLDLGKVEEETNRLTKQAFKELTKENVLSTEYESLLKELEHKEQELKELLKKPLKETHKKKVGEELQNISKLKNTLKWKQEEKLEEIRISLEEGLSKVEKDRIIEECMKWNQEITNEIQRKLLLDMEKKTQIEIRELEKQLMKQQLQRVANVLSAPLLISLPFIKNKYYRLFAGGFFVFQGLNWIQSLLFRSPNVDMLPDLNIIRSGRDALEEYAVSLARNKEMFKITKKEMLEKYPELLKDEEFIKLTNQIEYRLELEYQKYNEKTETVNRYFKKGKKLERKLKRKWI